jgi:hypothetical protein
LARNRYPGCPVFRRRREAAEFELVAGGGEQEPALVARRIRRLVQFRPGGALDPADIMAGRQRIGAQIPRHAQQVAKLQMLVAGDAGHWRLPGGVAVSEGGHHAVFKSLFRIDDVVRNAKPVRDALGVPYILPGAAGALTAAGGPLVVKLERNPDHLMPGARHQPGHHRAIDPT